MWNAVAGGVCASGAYLFVAEAMRQARSSSNKTIEQAPGAVVTGLSTESKASVATPFNRAVQFLRARNNGLKLNQQQQLVFYGLYKQATCGDNTAAKPGLLDFEGSYKWDAWTAYKGMSKEDVERRYIAELATISPTWDSASVSSAAALTATLPAAGTDTAAPSHSSAAAPASSRTADEDDDGIDYDEDEPAAGSKSSGGNGGMMGRSSSKMADASSGANASGYLSDDEASADDGLVSAETMSVIAAVRGGNTSECKRLIDSLRVANTAGDRNWTIDSVDANGQTALHHACDTGSADMVSLLLSLSATVNFQDDAGMTPLHVAASCCVSGESNAAHLDCIRELINHDADINIRDGEGNTPFQDAEPEVAALFQRNFGVSSQPPSSVSSFDSNPSSLSASPMPKAATDGFAAAAAAPSASQIKPTSPLVPAVRAKPSVESDEEIEALAGDSDDDDDAACDEMWEATQPMPPGVVAKAEPVRAPAEPAKAAEAAPAEPTAASRAQASPPKPHGKRGKGKKH